MTQFERLPNEVLLDIFEYFDSFNLLRGFADLNARFHTLLYQQFAFHCLNVSRMPKRHFDFVCQQHLSQLTSRIAVLKLFGGLVSPDKIDRFFSHVPSSTRFTRLRSLLISELHSHQTKMKLLDHLPYMISLTHLHLQLNEGVNQYEIDSQRLTNCVWSLPNLVRYNLFERIRDQPALFAMPSIVSSSLRHFSTLGRLLQWSMLGQLFQCTPNLRILRARMTFPHDDNYFPSSPFLTLTKLTIGVIGWPCLTRFFSLLQNTSNLRHLNVDLYTVLINGHQWQEVIHTHLPNLKSFELCMETSIDTEDEMERLMETFRSSFWTTERRFFVRCLVQERRLHVQTKSKWNYYSQKTFPRLFKSTYPQDSLPKLSEQLTTVYEETFFDHPFPADVRFQRLSSLSLKCPIAEQFWYVVTSVEQLTCLTISSYANRFAPLLHTILNRAPRLLSLSIEHEASEPMDMSWLERANTSVIDLTLSGRTLSGEECRALSRSPLATYCQTLNLRVEHCENILILVNAIPKLQSFFLPQCIDEDSLQWLRNQLRPSCSIDRMTDSINGIHIWLS